jgi:hypothetical protein
MKTLSQTPAPNIPILGRRRALNGPLIVIDDFAILSLTLPGPAGKSPAGTLGNISQRKSPEIQATPIQGLQVRTPKAGRKKGFRKKTVTCATELKIRPVIFHSNPILPQKVPCVG